jgi:hypothetical protein
MYSQDLLDWEIYFLTLKGYNWLYGLWVTRLRKAILRVCP